MIKNAQILKQINREKVLYYIYEQRNTTQKSIKDTLNLSRSTIIQIIKEFEDQGLVTKYGQCESTGGRRATNIYFSKYNKFSIGIELLKQRYEIVVLDLYGETIKYERFFKSYQNTDEYYKTVCNSLKNIIDELNISDDKILGVGIVLQALISTDGNKVTYGKILDCTGLSIDVFSKYLPYKLKFYHDAEAAIIDELWQSPQTQNAIYMNIRSDMSGAIVIDRKSLFGEELKSGVFEHMTIVPHGKPCYCGNKGCMNVYCSTSALINKNETLELFFENLRSGDTNCKTRWTEYLNYLAIAINNIHMFIDCNIIIGGTIAKYIQGIDINMLHKLVHDNTAFPTEREFIKVTCCANSPICRGAAISYIKEYLYSILGHDIIL